MNLRDSLDQLLFKGLLYHKNDAGVVKDAITIFKENGLYGTSEEFLYGLMVFCSYYCYVKRRNPNYNITNDADVLIIFNEDDCVLLNELVDFMNSNYSCDLLEHKYEQFQWLLNNIMFD